MHIICYTKDTVKSSNNLSGYNTFKKNLNLPVTVVTHKIQVASLNLNIFNINGPSPLFNFGPFVILVFTYSSDKSIRIYHECEGGIEKPVPKITDWHQEACRVMTNGDLEGQNFLFHPHTNNRINSCSPLNTAFYI